MRIWDYIVVGGGSAGAVVAARLSEDPSVSVLLIEAGGDGSALWLQVPNGVYFARGDPRFHWMTPIEADPTRLARTDLAVGGRGIGGGSAVNGMVFLKGLASDYERWREAAGDRWGPDAVDKVFRGIESRLGVGPPSSIHPTADLFMRSARTFGFPNNSPELPRTAAGVMPCPTNAAKGWRQGSYRGYFRAARDRKNLTTVTNAVAQRLILRDGRVEAVAVSKNGREEIYHAAKEVVLSAGAINTPAILMRSGIGSAAHLRECGVEPLVDLPAVGEGLQDHPCVWMTMTVDQKTWNDTLRLPGLVGAALQWLVSRTGPAASGMCHAIVYGSTEASDIPNFQMGFTPAGYVVSSEGVVFLPSSAVSVVINLCRPQGRGSVRLRSPRPDDPPIVNYRLLDSPEDVAVIRDACRMLRGIYRTEPLAARARAEVIPGPQVETDEEWEHFIRSTAANMFHPGGTCRMGKDASSVVDPELRVRGVDGLRIADASIMPYLPSGNTNAPSMMIGEQAADFIMNGV